MAKFEASSKRRVTLRSNNNVPLLMGIVNATPDSFYAGSRHGSIELGMEFFDKGATWVDVGGESTRPGSDPVPLEEEMRRVIPVIEALAQRGLVSVDTRHHEVAEAAINAGAAMVNDVTGLTDPKMMQLVINSGVAVCIMHMQGKPKTMQDNPEYQNVVEEVTSFLHAQAKILLQAGHPIEKICLDPGIGFGKTLTHNIQLLQSAGALKGEQSFPLLWGVSRKSMIGEICQKTNPDERLAGTLGVAGYAMKHDIDILRVHDIDAHADFFSVYSRLSQSVETM